MRSKKKGSRYRTLRSLAGLLTTLLSFELALGLILYFVVPYFLTQYGGIGTTYSSPNGLGISPQSPVQGLPIGIYVFSLPFYIGVVSVFISILALFASFFSLSPKMIILSLFGFLFVIVSGYAWMLTYSEGSTSGVIYPLVMFLGLIIALSIYSVETKVIVRQSARYG
jgi:hypothetical protein